ncbi:MAG: hypothetical protein AAGE03_08620 [Pseudomonadota bacterium]
MILAAVASGCGANADPCPPVSANARQKVNAANAIRTGFDPRASHKPVMHTIGQRQNRGPRLGFLSAQVFDPLLQSGEPINGDMRVGADGRQGHGVVLADEP